MIGRKHSLSFVLVAILLLSVGLIFYPTTAKNNELVIVAHGLARSDNAMWLMEKRFEQEGYEVCLLDYKTIGQNNESLFSDTEQQIDNCLNGKRTHFVGHSLGGLVIKNYLNKETNRLKIVELGEVVFAGTPNRGSEVADAMKDHYLMKIGGEVAKSLMTGIDTLGDRLGKSEVAIGVIAGSKSIKLTEQYFTTPNDGLVSVESTKTANMKDFIVLEVSHAAMRYDKDVAAQILHYLKNGYFSR